jgi:AcrR family transcriptional regulator
MGLRLQDIAADVGISHPAVLHHFGSREALVHAVIQRAILSLQKTWSDLSARPSKARFPTRPRYSSMSSRLSPTAGTPA